MILSALKYTRYIGSPREWGITGKDNSYAYFGNINLLVGKNASGKSRTLNVIREIANLLSGKCDLEQAISPSEHIEMIFTEGEHRYKYILDFKERAVTNEILYVGNKIVLVRKKKILLSEDDKSISFDIPEAQLVITLQDSEGQHYFNKFVSWGLSLKNYLFANQVEKSHLVKDYTKVEYSDPEAEDPEVLVYTFYKGRELFGDIFVNEIISNMHELGYSISNIDIQKAKNNKYGLSIEEYGEYTVSQYEISQGMFRALSLLITLTYARLSDASFCLLLDDMGEGIDFEKSKKLIDIVIKKVNKSNMQFFMTSNDRHVMNQISLRFWTVIGRENNRSVFYDYTNSKDTFEDFKYTGLNNFDFLATDFYSKGFGIIDEDNE